MPNPSPQLTPPASTQPTPVATPPRPDQRIRPLVAWRAVRRLVANPDDTREVFVIIDALSGKSGERLFERFRKTDTGRCVLAERRDITARLADQASLRALPEASLGRTYAEFMAREQLSPDGLAEASEGNTDGVLLQEADRVLFGTRLRDTHDLWHVVTGYGRDLVGEASLLAFTFAQTRNPGIGFIVLMAYLLARGEISYGRQMMRDAYRRGRAARWMPGADWEALLERPLAEVRSTLAVGEPPRYRQVRSAAGEAALAAH